MNSFTQYVWGIYFVAALGLIAMLWYSLRRVRSAVVQDVSVVLAIALLLTPSSAVPGSSDLAPALVALIIEGLFDSELSGWRGGVPILLVAVSLLILVFAKYWIVARFFTGRDSSALFASANGAPAVPEETAPKAIKPEAFKPETLAPEVPPAEPQGAEPVTAESLSPEPLAPDSLTPEPVTPEPVTPEPRQPTSDSSAPGNGSPSNTN